MNKRGDIFAVYLVVMTIFMMAVVVGFHIYQVQDVKHSLVSPGNLLVLQDNKEIFEMQEKKIIQSSIDKSSETWGNNVEEIRNEFFSLLILPEQEQFREFLFSDLMFEGEDLEKSSFDDEDSQREFYRKIYEFDFVEDAEEIKLQVLRKPVGKHLFLSAQNRSKINFPVEVEYVYEKMYLFEKTNI